MSPYATEDTWGPCQRVQGPESTYAGTAVSVDRSTEESELALRRSAGSNQSGWTHHLAQDLAVVVWGKSVGHLPQSIAALTLVSVRLDDPGRELLLAVLARGLPAPPSVDALRSTAAPDRPARMGAGGSEIRPVGR